MTIPVLNIVLQQGADTTITLPVMADSTGVPIDLSGYSLRMVIRDSASSVLVFSLNSDDNDPETTDLVTLGTDGTISMIIPRAASLQDGPLYNQIGKVLLYDVMLRDPNNLQQKILRGTVVMEASQTQWV